MAFPSFHIPQMPLLNSAVHQKGEWTGICYVFQRVFGITGLAVCLCVFDCLHIQSHALLPFPINNLSSVLIKEELLLFLHSTQHIETKVNFMPRFQHLWRLMWLIKNTPDFSQTFHIPSDMEFWRMLFAYLSVLGWTERTKVLFIFIFQCRVTEQV